MLTSATVPFLVLAMLTLVPSAPQDATEGSDPPAFVVTERQKFVDGVELEGTFVPADPQELSLWPEAYSGELLFLEVAPHGTYVNAGDVIARFSPDALDDQLRDAELDLASAEIQHANKLEQARIDAEAALSQRERKQAAIERARRALQGWETFELEFKRRSNELSAQFTQHGIDDQVDELSQLEAMYRDDELVDATEEIVLKRARRRLASSRVSQKLSEERRKYETQYDVAAKTAVQREAVEAQMGELDRLVRSQELAARSRKDGLERSAHELAKKKERLEELRRDKEGLVLRAPRGGVLLHGGAQSLGLGQVRPDHQRGERGATRTPLFCVASPDRLAIALTVGEAQLARVRSGLSVTVHSLVTPDKPFVGTLALESYPTPESVKAKEAAFAGHVTLEGKQPGLVAGMHARVEVVADSLDDVILIPRAAVFGSGDSAYCWAASAGSGAYSRLPVKLGPAKGSEVVVYGELDAGQRVLLSEPSQ